MNEEGLRCIALNGNTDGSGTVYVDLIGAKVVLVLTFNSRSISGVILGALIP